MTGRREKDDRPKKRLYSIPEAGEYLVRTVWAIREMIWRGKLPAVRDGRRVLWAQAREGPLRGTCRRFPERLPDQ